MTESPSSRQARHNDVEAYMDRIDAGAGWLGRLYWMVRPTVYECTSRFTHQQPGHTQMWTRTLSMMGAGAGMKYRHQAGLLAGVASRNEARVLRQVMAARGEHVGAGPMRVVRPSPSMRGLPDLEVSSGVRLLAESATIPHFDVTSRVKLARKIARAAITFQEASAIIVRIRPRVVVVANQHSPGPRALLAAAIVAKVPTLYFPHAPLSTSPAYRDLPVTLAGLRGDYEVQTYGGYGATSSRLVSVGDPTLPATSESVQRPVSSPVSVLALSPLPRTELESIIRFVARAQLHSVVVCPHPSSNLAALRPLLPQDWRLATEPTLSVLQRGARLVMQQSSGVGLEALALGLPVVEISLPGHTPGYAFIREPQVPIVRTSDQLRDAATRFSRASDRDAFERRTWARLWTGPVGEEARINAVNAVELVSELPNPGRLALDRVPGLTSRRG